MKDIDAAIKWYKDRRHIFELLAHKVEDIVKENLEQNKIQYHSITSRPKSIESYSEKAKNEKYIDPIKDILDMSGIRIITYLESDVEKVATIIESIFDIDKENSLDQSQLLGSDKLGYRSVHYIAKFNRKRCNLPEYKPYRNLPFEIQIRSILQHAWAEIEHDRNYKFSGKLPTQLERRFYLVSGMLECADREFVSIAQEIDKYKESVVKELTKGDLDIEINTTSVREYLTNKFKLLVDKGLLATEFGGRGMGGTIIEELRLFGILNIYQLDTIIPENFQDNMIEAKDDTNLSGLTRNILIANDVNKYFKKCWRREWQGIHASALHFLSKYDVNLSDLNKYMGSVDVL